MLSILSQPAAVPERDAETHPAPLRGGETEMEPVDLELSAETREEFEIVLGRRQIASVLFVASVILAVFAGVSYLAGKSISPRKEMPDVPAVATDVSMPAAPITPQIPPPIPMIDATVVLSSPPPASTPTTSPAELPEISTEAPMFAEPVTGSMYLQMGAVGRGAAAIFAGGLRKRGFQSFVARGPSETIYRVLIGPLSDPAAYTRTKAALDRIGVNTFSRKYEK